MSDWPDISDVFNAEWRKHIEYKDAANWKNAPFDPLPAAKNPQMVRSEQLRAERQTKQGKENNNPFDDFDQQLESNVEKFEPLDNSF